MFQFAAESGQQVLGEELSEGVGQAGVGDAFDVDVDGIEDGLVQVSLRLSRSALVGDAEMAGESERGLKVAFGCFPVDFGRGQRGSGIGDLFGQPGLSLFEEVDRDGASGVSLQQLATFGFEGGDAFALLSGSFLGAAGVAPDRVKELVVEIADDIVAELDGLVVGGDAVFDSGDREAGQVAVVSFLVASETQEVVVLAAMPA